MTTRKEMVECGSIVVSHFHFMNFVKYFKVNTLLNKKKIL